MPVTSVLVGLSLLAAAWLAAFLPYRLREPVHPARPWLVGLRTGTLFLLALLLWNPSVGQEAPDPSDHSRWVLLDRTLGMAAEGVEGTSAWEEGVAHARERADGGARVAVYDGVLETLDEGAHFNDLDPERSGRRLASGLEGLLEAGIMDVEVVSDFRLEDSARLRELGIEAPGGMEVHPVGGTVRNVGLAQFEVPAQVEAGEELEVEVALHGEGAEEGDSVEVEVREEADVLLAETLPAVVGEGVRSHTLTLPPFQEDGLHRLEATGAMEGDGFAHDDERVGYVVVEEARRGIAVVALEPGWEERQLLPVMERATGLEGAGFLRLGDEGYLPIRTDAPGDDPALEGVDPDADGQPGLMDPAEVAEVLEEVRILVVVGLSGDPPDEVRQALDAVPGVLAFVADSAASELLELPLEGPRTGEWSVVEELPASPLAGELAGAGFQGLPPLEGVVDADEGDGWEAVFHLEADERTGLDLAGLLVRARDGERHAVATASGFWRWAARGGEAREAYRRLWSAVAGELLRAGDPRVQAAGPEDRVVGREESVAWQVEGVGDQPVRVEVRQGQPEGPPDALAPVDDDPVMDRVVVPDEDGRFRTPSLAPGPYVYRLTLAEGDPDEPLGQGPFDVDPYAGDLELPPRPLEPVPAAEEGEAPVREEGAGVPLRTHPLPYLLALAFLCIEWIARRRTGLR